jgi:ribose transport system substrate-binding protein
VSTPSKEAIEMKNHLVRAGVSALTALVLAIGYAGCGGDSEPPADEAAATGGGKPLSFFEERLGRLYEGDSYTEPATDGPKAAAGKNVWMIPLGLNYTAGEESANGAREAAEAMGWDLRVFDGKFDPNTILTGIRQAIAAKADGIILFVVDCAGIRSGLEEAKRAGIPVVGVESIDCNEAKQGAPKLFASGRLTYNGEPYESRQLTYAEWISNYARAAADSIIVATKGKAKAINFHQTDAQANNIMDVGFKEEMKLCGGCEIVSEVKFIGTDFGPPLQQKASQALLQHPEANSIYGSYDAPITSGIAAAVRQAGRTADLWITGGEGDPPNVDLVIERKGQDAGVAAPIRWEMWSGFDVMNRIFAGDPEPAVKSGIGLMVWDRDRNLPPRGEFLPMPIDYASAYRGAWGKE